MTENTGTQRQGTQNAQESPGKKQARSALQKIRDQADIARLRLFGHTQRQIADKMGLALSTVNRDLAEIAKRWRDSALEDIAEIKARELAKLDALEIEAFDEWRHSKKDTKKTVVEEKPGRQGKDSDKPAPKQNGVRIETTTNIGDPRFLQLILSIQERRSKMLGLDAPAKFEGSVENKGALDASALSDAALAELMAARRAIRANPPV